METLRSFFQTFSKYSHLHHKSAKEFDRHFELYLQPLADKPLDEIKRKDIVDLQASLVENRNISAANKAVELIVMLYNKAAEFEVYEGRNPGSRVKKFKRQPRERFADADELERIFAAIENLQHKTSRDFFKMKLYTGQRRRNVCNMRWSEIDWQRRVWRIPMTKNGSSHSVPLIQQAMDILADRKRDGHDVYVFAKRDRSGPVWNLGHAWERVLSEAGVKDFRLHDLRRTHASWMAITGASLPIIGRTLAHKDPKSTIIYARLNDAPVREAMETAMTAALEKVESTPLTHIPQLPALPPKSASAAPRSEYLPEFFDTSAVCTFKLFNAFEHYAKARKLAEATQRSYRTRIKLSGLADIDVSQLSRPVLERRLHNLRIEYVEKGHNARNADDIMNVVRHVVNFYNATKEVNL